MGKSSFVFSVFAMIALIVPISRADLAQRTVTASNDVATSSRSAPVSERADTAPLAAADLQFNAVAHGTEFPETQNAPTPTPPRPRHLHIPSIDLSSPVIDVGINSKGEMDVPSGKTNHVGWYQYGTVPGDTGSAVLDAHVYAAFKNLKHMRIGDEILVTTEGGETRRFVTRDIVTYRLEDLSPEFLFNRADARRLNLITCAGTWNTARQDYSHRLVVFGEFIE